MYSVSSLLRFLGKTSFSARSEVLSCLICVPERRRTPLGALAWANEVEIEEPAEATSRKRVCTSAVLFLDARRRISR